MYTNFHPKKTIRPLRGAFSCKIALAAFFISICFNHSLAATPLFGQIEVEDIVDDSANLDSLARKQAMMLDSLMNCIQIDSITDYVYATFPAYYNRPRVLASFHDTPVQGIQIPPVNFADLAGVTTEIDSVAYIYHPASLPATIQNPIPLWFRELVNRENVISDANYRMMVADPSVIEYANWDLPQTPRMPDQDFSFHGYLKRLNLPDVDTKAEVVPEIQPRKVHWLHKFNVGLQFSQAYVSSNWYQGGNSYLAGLFNFNWNVDLNNAYHPNLLFQSALEYKLGVNSNPKGSLHRYTTSQDLFQYSLKTGLKAFNNHWYYSLNLLFQTQLFNSYPADSEQRTSTIMSPGMLNVGIGMTYNLEALKGRLKLSASISPLAYNLKTCLADDIDRAQFGMQPGQKTLNEIGSSAEINLTWNFTDNISWKSRLFLFSDYHNFLGDWENTFNFQINKFLSSQIFLHPRFDTSSEASATKWRHWMFREVLSFGISYTFTTKP